MLEAIRAASPSRESQETTVHVGTNILAAVFEEPALRSRTATNIGRAWVKSETAQKQAQLDASARIWNQRARQWLNTISIAKKSLTLLGNSAELTRFR